jgi:hypothetical protein
MCTRVEMAVETIIETSVKTAAAMVVEKLVDILIATIAHRAIDIGHERYAVSLKPLALAST